MSRSKRTYNATKIPGLPKVPSDISPQAKRYLEMLTEAVEIRLGRRGDARDSAVTFRDLFDAGLASEGPWVFNQATGVTGTTLNPNGGDPTAADPTAPTGFDANGAFSKIIVSWDYPFDQFFGYANTEIWRHDADILGDAQLVGTDTGMVFVDEVGEGAAYYYWGRHVNEDGVAGPFNSNAGTFAETSIDVVFMLELLTDMISEDQFAQSLKDEIDLISIMYAAIGDPSNPAPNTALYDLAAAQSAIYNANLLIAAAQADITVAENDIVSLQTVTASQTTQLNTLNTTVGANGSSIANLQTTTANQATDITNLTTTVNGHGSSITNLQTTTGANATSITQLQTDVGNNSSSITSLQTTTATNAQDITALNTSVYNPSTGLAAISNAVSGLQTSVTNINGTLTSHSSDITSLNNAVYDPSNGLAATSNALSALSSTVSSQGVNVTANSQAVTALQNTVNHPYTGVSAQSTAINNLTSRVTSNEGTISAHTSDISAISSTVNGNTASISQQAVTNASLIGDITALEAEYSVKVDVNGNVAGFGLASGGSPQYSRFYVNADKFAIVPPGNSGTSSGIVPFAVVSSPLYKNGVYVPAGTYIADAMIANGSIASAKIGNLAVDTAQIADLAIETAKIDNFAITSAKIQDLTVNAAKIANATITGAKIGNAQIGTLQLAGESVTVPRFAQNTISNVYLSSTPISVCSLWLNGGYVPPGQNARVVIMGVISAYPGNSTITNLRLHIYSGSTVHNTIGVTYKDYGIGLASFGSFLIGNNFSDSISLRVSCTANPGGSSTKSSNSFDCKLIVMSAKR